MLVTQLLLTGSLAAADPGRAVARWQRLARQATEQTEVSGALLFDGERWIALLEGGEDALAALGDPLQHGGAMGTAGPALRSACPTPRLCSGWRSGYVETPVIDLILHAIPTGIAPALAALLDALRNADTL
jgi:hypothetical protein